MSQRTRVDKVVMVLGGSLEAGWVARELLDLGYAVILLSPERLPSDELNGHRQLVAYDNCELVGLDGHVGGFSARCERQGQTFTVAASAIVVATGNERYFPAERYGFKLSSRVLTVPQIWAQLTAPRSTGAALPYRNERILVLLDFGGETAKETATEALHLAMAVRETWHSEVYTLYQNLQVDSQKLERLTREMRQRGVIFCRYADPEISVDDDGVSVSYIEGSLRGDRLVLPEAVRPRGDTPALATQLRVRLGTDGYFQDINIRQYRPGLSVRRGIFFAGRCHLDADLPEIRADAAQAAANVDALLHNGYLAPEDIIAHVDATRCIRCLTCIRTCPHAAIELADDETAVAARVVDLACQGCGACIANCPVRAIDLVGQPLPAWMRATPARI